MDEEMDAEIDAIIAHIETWHSRRDEIHQRAVAWVRSPAFVTTFYDNTHAPLLLKIVLAKEMKKKELTTLWANAEKQGIQSPALLEQYGELVVRGQVIFAQGVIANPGFRSSPHSQLPCLFLASGNQSPEGVAVAGFLASALGDLYAQGEGAAERPRLLALVRDDDFQLFRRRPLPPEETEGFTGTLLDIQIRKSWMPPDSVPFVPLLFLPGPQGAVLQIPWFVALGEAPAESDLQEGNYAEFGRLDRTADVELAKENARRAKKRSWAGKLVAGFFLFCAGSAAYDSWTGKTDKTRPPATGASKWRATEKTIRWVQPAAVRNNVNVLPAAEYEPLIGEGVAGSGFLFRGTGGMILAATSRHQFESDNQAPGLLFSIDDAEATLDKDQPMPQPKSWIQMVTAVKGHPGCLEYSPTDVVNKGDEVWLIVGKGKWISGTVVTAKSPRSRPGTEPVRIRVKVVTEENVGGSSGAPIVHAATGRVVGIMQAAEKAEKPSWIEFETIRLDLTDETLPPSTKPKTGQGSQ